jgi:hypothetical protein
MSVYIAKMEHVVYDTCCMPSVSQTAQWVIQSWVPECDWLICVAEWVSRQEHLATAMFQSWLCDSWYKHIWITLAEIQPAAMTEEQIQGQAAQIATSTEISDASVMWPRSVTTSRSCRASRDSQPTVRVPLWLSDWKSDIWHLLLVGTVCQVNTNIANITSRSPTIYYDRCVHKLNQLSRTFILPLLSSHATLSWWHMLIMYAYTAITSFERTATLTFRTAWKQSDSCIPRFLCNGKSFGHAGEKTHPHGHQDCLRLSTETPLEHVRTQEHIRW